jgi:cysteine desulfurase / selenocysteine lyase
MRVDEFRSRFPITSDRAYLFSGAMAPAADTVISAAREWLSDWASQPLRRYDSALTEMDALRDAVGAVLRVDGGHVALTANTSQASNTGVRILLSDLDQSKRNANVVVDRTTYPSSRYPWLVLGHIELRVASSASPGAMTDAIAERTDDDTVAIVVSHVDPLTGIRHDLEALAEVARRHAAALMVDVAQSAGVLEIPTHLDEVRVVVGTTMKWLLGTPGIGFLYVHPRLMDRVDGLDVGYLGLYLGAEPFPQSWMPQRRADAGRFELGLPNMGGLVPSAEGIRLVMGLGQRVVLDRISCLAGYCIEGLRDAGIAVRTPIEPRHRAGVVAFDTPSAPELAEYLRTRRVDVGGYRWGLGRVDPHAFNNEEDVERFLAGVQAFQNGRTGT